MAIDEANFYDVFQAVRKDPDKYREVRLAGRKFVLENHTIDNRVSQFKTILERISNAV
jgi:hypothetical protein